MIIGQEQKRKRILVYQIGSIGDTIVSIPALRVIRRHYGSDAKIVLLHDVRHGVLTPSNLLAGGHLCILRVGFYGYRFMLGSFLLDALPQDQSSSETAYSFEFEGQCSNHRYHYFRQGARCEHFRQISSGIVDNLHYRSWLSGPLASLYYSQNTSIICDTRQEEYQIQKAIISSGKKIKRNKKRSSWRTGRLLPQAALSRKKPQDCLCRSGNQETSYFSNQQHEIFVQDDYESPQGALASRIVFQMDQITFKNQSFLWHIRKRDQNANLGCNFSLCSDCHNQKEARFKIISLLDFKDSERGVVRKGANFGKFNECKLFGRS